MGVLGTLITFANGTTISSSDMNSNFSDVKSSVNNIVADQITDGTIGNAEISTNGIFLAKIKGVATTDATLDDVTENFLDGCWLKRDSDTVLSVSRGSAKINGRLRRTTSSTTDTPSLTASKWTDVYLDGDASASTWALEVIGNQTNPNDSTATATNSRLIGSIYVDASGDLTAAKIIQYRRDQVVGYSYVVGTGTNTLTDAVTHGATFLTAQAPSLSWLGSDTTALEPADISQYNEATSYGYVVFGTDSVSTTAFTMKAVTSSGSWSAGSYYGYKWVIDGAYTL